MTKPTPTRQALIIASYQYQDPDLRQLVAPAQDAEALARVLQDPAIGGFQVQTLLNEPSHQVNRAIEAFFVDRKRDDLLLLYFSGHGIKDDWGRLYFAATDTRYKTPRTTAIPASLVNEVMADSRSRRQVLLLDCCYSGAFARTKADKSVGIKEQVGGRGRVVLTSSNAVQYSFEGDEVAGEGVRSVFTRVLVQGLETGDADRDRDGRVSLDELYEYVYDRVVDETPKQRPQMFATVEGKIIIARSPVLPPQASLPGWITAALASGAFSARLAAVGELTQLIHGQDRALAAVARAELERLSEKDENPTIRGAAAGALGTKSSVVSGPSPAPPPPPVTSPPTSLKDAEVHIAGDVSEWAGIGSHIIQIGDVHLGKEHTTRYIREANGSHTVQISDTPGGVVNVAMPKQKPPKPDTLTITSPIRLELIRIPAGEFLMGSDPAKDKDAHDTEQPQHTVALPQAKVPVIDTQPQHTVALPEFHIGKYPVTNAQYTAFVQSTGHRTPKHWENGEIPSGQEDHPVRYVFWEDVMAFCRWLSQETGQDFLLPSEAEWEKAARSADGRIYPWGDNSPTADLCNFAKNVGDTTPVGKYSPGGDSPYGCADMAGNVWEWTRSRQKDYPYNPDDGREDLGADSSRVVRGGAFYVSGSGVRCAYRGQFSPFDIHRDPGFRVVAVSP